MIIFKQFIQSLAGLIVLSTTIMAIDIQPLPKDFGLTKALSVHCLQKTQTQQLLKEYIKIGLHIRYGKPIETLKDAIVKYDKRLHALNDFFQATIKDEDSKKQLADAIPLWNENKAMLEAPPTKENALKIQKNWMKILKLFGATKVLVKKDFEIIKQTANLCYIPQYMANVYLMKIWGIDIPRYKEKMEKNIETFDKNLALLRKNNRTTDVIKKELKSIERAFMFFKFTYDSDTTSVPSLIARKADKIFKNVRSSKKKYRGMAE